MGTSWRPDERSHSSFAVPVTLRPLLVLLAAGIVLRWACLELQTREQHQRLAGYVSQAALSESRRAELESTIASQHQRLTRTESDLETLRYEIEAVEMQLDGVDTLSRQLREEMGLPQSAGTWSNGAGAEPPQGGGADASGVDEERLAVVRRRLSNGLSELFALQAYAEQRRQAAMIAPGAAPAAAVVEPANWPARGSVTSDFGWRIFRGVPNYHTGIDIALAYGTPVQATADGAVIGSGWQPGYGWSVLMQHGGGYNTLYAHLAALSVSLGNSVRQGDVVGLSGSSGTSTGPHLHYEIWRSGALVDPRPYMDGAWRR